MTRFALYPNDAGVTLLDEQRIVYRQPGYAHLSGSDLSLGNKAFQQARIDPRGIQHRYWSELSVEPLPDRQFEHLSSADLVSRQLEELWAEIGGSGHDLVIAVPGYFSNERLGLLLGIAADLGIPVAGMVEGPVAATRREYQNAVPVHIELGLHSATLTRMGQSGVASAERTEVLDDCGLYAMYDTWLSVVAEAFVQQSRFDPLHAADTEQMLLDQLARWMADASHQSSVVLELNYGGLDHRAEVETLALVNAVAPIYQTIASRLRALFRAGDTPALQVTDRVARLPGLSEQLKARVGGEVFSLEAGATARGALARLRDVSPGSGAVSLRRQLPWDQAAFSVDAAVSEESSAGAPTHLLFHHTAYPIGDTPLVLGSQPGAGGNGDDRPVTLDGEMPGLSRRHCSLSISGGKCVIEDHSRYGTFLNGYRISGSTVLQVGDNLRVGSPGFEFLLITTDDSHGA